MEDKKFLYSVYIETYFSSAHKLKDYKGKCENLHGHNWKVGVEVSKEILDRQQMVIDFVKLKKIVNKIIKNIDHKYLNQINYFKLNQPTAENIAKYICDNLKILLRKYNIKKIKIIVWETSVQYASYEEEI